MTAVKQALCQCVSVSVTVVEVESGFERLQRLKVLDVLRKPVPGDWQRLLFLHHPQLLIHLS